MSVFLKLNSYCIFVLYQYFVLTFALSGQSLVPGVTMTNVWSFDVFTFGVGTTWRSRQTFVDIFVAVRTCEASICAATRRTASGFVAIVSFTATHVVAVMPPAPVGTRYTQQRIQVSNVSLCSEFHLYTSTALQQFEKKSMSMSMLKVDLYSAFSSKNLLYKSHANVAVLTMTKGSHSWSAKTPLYNIYTIYHTIQYSFNNVADMRNVQQIHIEIEMKWVNVKYN